MKRVGISLVIFAVAIALGFYFFGGNDTESSVDEISIAAQDKQNENFLKDMWRNRLAQLKYGMAHISRETVRVSGTAVDRETGTPIAHATVNFVDHGTAYETTADHRGHYSVALGKGAYRVYAQAENYVAVGHAEAKLRQFGDYRKFQGQPRFDLAPVVNLSEPQEGVDVFLTGSATIKGTVLNESGFPVPGATVSTVMGGDWQKSVRNILGNDFARTDIDGVFELVVTAGMKAMSVEHMDYAGVPEEDGAHFILDVGEVKSVRLTLVEGCIIEGTVVDEAGMLFKDGVLDIGTDGEGHEEFDPVEPFTGGKFRFTRTETGPIELRAWPWKAPPSAPQSFACNSGDIYDDVAFVVPNTEPDIHGWLFTDDGEPVSGAYVYLIPLGGHGFVQRERTDENGEWEVFVMPKGPYMATAHAPHHGVAAMGVACPSSENELVLRGTGSINGSVDGVENGSFSFSPTGCNVQTKVPGYENFFVHLGKGQPRDVRTVPVKDGHYEINDLPACDLEAHANHKQRSVFVGPKVEADGMTDCPMPLVERTRHIEHMLDAEDVFYKYD